MFQDFMSVTAARLFPPFQIFGVVPFGTAPRVPPAELRAGVMPNTVVIYTNHFQTSKLLIAEGVHLVYTLRNMIFLCTILVFKDGIKFQVIRFFLDMMYIYIATHEHLYLHP
jgi:hypothetical protein